MNSRFTLGLSIALLLFSMILAAAGNANAAQSSGETKSSTGQANSSITQQDGNTQVATLSTVATQPAGDTGGSGGASPQSTSGALNPGKKFTYFARSSFLPPTPYALSVLAGVYGEATDKDHHRHMSGGDFLADSMTHAARSFAFRATANFFEKFAYASAFKQDPRYFRSDKRGIGRIGYAISHVFVTRSDGGKDQFNASFFAGGLTAAGISKFWSRKEDRTFSSTMGRFGTHIGYRALSNVIKELFGR